MTPVGMDLARAVDLLQTRGWCTGAYKSPSGHMCAVGAILEATGLIAAAGPPRRRRDGSTAASDAIDALAAAVLGERGVLGSVEQNNAVTEWNDRQGHRADVLEAFQVAIDMANGGEL